MKRRTQKITYNIVVGVLIACGIAWVSAKFIHLGKVEYTDNAQVKQLIVPVNSRVQGFIQKIYFDEYQKVRKGDTLAIIEDAEFRLRLAQAEADYQNALSGKTVMTSTIHTTQNNISVSDAGKKTSDYQYRYTLGIHANQVGEDDGDTANEECDFCRETEFKPEHNGECQSHSHHRRIPCHHDILLHQSRGTYHLADRRQIDTPGELEYQDKRYDNPRS